MHRRSKELLGSAQILRRIFLGPETCVDPRNCANRVLCWAFRCWDLAREFLERCVPSIPTTTGALGCVQVFCYLVRPLWIAPKKFKGGALSPLSRIRTRARP